MGFEEGDVGAKTWVLLVGSFSLYGYSYETVKGGHLSDSG